MAAPLPLQGIRVVNFGWVWAGPVVGQTLAFLGAEVLKIESRARLDMTRILPPFAEGIVDPDRSLSNHAGWAGNGSVTLDLRQAEARALALRLIAESDVVVENFGPGVIERLGFGYQALRKVKPDIILFSMPAAGLSGPLEHVRTYGLSLTSLTGLDSLVGYKGESPIPVENAFSDPYAGIFGAFAIIVALNHRRHSGQGQHIEFSQQEAVMQMVGPAYMDYLFNGRSGAPKGNEHPTAAAAPHGVFRCSGEDRWIAIAAEDDAQWRALVRAMGEPDWARAPQYDTLAGRLAAIDRLHAEIGAWTCTHERHALAQRLQDAGVAATPVLDVGDLLDDPQYRARGTYVEVEHPLGFRETIYGRYVKMSRAADAPVQTGPTLGRDNDHAFREILRLPEDEYRRLKDSRVIY